jgi:hypothetical protein
LPFSGPFASCTTSTSPLSFTTNAPTPTWCDALGGSVLGASGSQRVIIT